MRKKLIAFGMAMILFAGSSMTTLADGVCPGSNTGGHVFECEASGMGTMEDMGYHEYYFGEEDGISIYKYDCMRRRSISYCSKKCRKCGYVRENSQHSHVIGEWHSIIHR